MFERGKKEQGWDEAPEARSPGTVRRQESAMPAATSRHEKSAVIGRSIQINGDLRGNEDLRIEGDVSGTVELKNSSLTIGKEGKVRADVYAKSIAVDGTTEGDLYALERVIVHVNAKVRGNITAPKVGIEEGARFKGSIEMDPEAVEKALGKAKMSADTKPAADRQPGKAAEAKVGAKNSGKEASSSFNPSAGVR